MSDIQKFTHEDLGFECRVTDMNGEPWFVAKDVCESLGLDTSNLSKVLDEDERSTCPVQYTDQVRNVAIVNQPYQTYVDRGYFRCIEQKYTVPDGETRISIKTVVYQKGVDFIRRLIERSHDTQRLCLDAVGSNA